MTAQHTKHHAQAMEAALDILNGPANTKAQDVIRNSDLKTQDRDEAFKLWLEVLRDPKSEKTQGRLEDPDNAKARCCLGHACHALGEERYVKTSGAGYPSQAPYIVMYAGDAGVLSEGAASLLGIQPDGLLKESDGGVKGMYTLVDLNDDTNLTPAEIADVIECLWQNDGFEPYDNS